MPHMTRAFTATESSGQRRVGPSRPRLGLGTRLARLRPHAECRHSQARPPHAARHTDHHPIAPHFYSRLVSVRAGARPPTHRVRAAGRVRGRAARAQRRAAPGRARRGRAASRLARVRRDRGDGRADVGQRRCPAAVADGGEARDRRGRARGDAVLGRLPRRPAPRRVARREGVSGAGAGGRAAAGEHDRRGPHGSRCSSEAPPIS